MGIPSYFKHIVQKYKHLTSKNGKKYHSLYFDMNCIIHPICRRIMELNPDCSENDMFEEVMKEVVKIITHVSPEQMVYLAVDGIAPMAKVIQQRYRRFRNMKEKRMLNKNEKWNSNIVTPGTTFMEHLNTFLTNWVKQWNKNNDLKILLSDSGEPGEGEHKIFDYLREFGNEDDYYCVYGLDADLIMISLINKFKIDLIREELHFNRVVKNQFGDIEYLFLDIKELENCIIAEIKEMCQEKLYDNEDLIEFITNIDKHVVVDYVFLCFFIGNDFIPAIPMLRIKDGGIHYLLDIYTRILVSKRRYIVNNDGLFDKNSVAIILNSIFKNEDKMFDKMHHKWKTFRLHCKYEGREKEEYLINRYPLQQRDNIPYKIKEWKNKYYLRNFHIKNRIFSKKSLHSICKKYIEGLYWILRYYTQGCIDWRWYYPYISAPLAGELVQCLIGLKPNHIKFNLESKPLTNAEQLLITIPPTSYYCLPQSIRKLTDHPYIQIQNPKDFEVNFMWKYWHHECNPILPYIDNIQLQILLENETN